MTTDYHALATQQIEDRAYDEWRTNNGPIWDFLETLDLASDIAPLLTLAYRAKVEPGCRGTFADATERMAHDYVAWRTRQCANEIAATAGHMERQEYEATRDAMRDADFDAARAQ